MTIYPTMLTNAELVSQATSMLQHGDLPKAWQEELVKRFEDLLPEHTFLKTYTAVRVTAP